MLRLKVYLRASCFSEILWVEAKRINIKFYSLEEAVKNKYT